jgi:hypothetical protein
MAAWLIPVPDFPQISPTSETSYCQKYSYYDSTYGTTVCLGMNVWATNLGSTTFTGTFASAITSCQSYCFSMYSSATGGWLTGSEALTSHTCTCFWAVTAAATPLSCWYGLGFVKGERPDVLARR